MSPDLLLSVGKLLGIADDPERLNSFVTGEGVNEKEFLVQPYQECWRTIYNVTGHAKCISLFAGRLFDDAQAVAHDHVESDNWT
ncbi:hypothetical protein KDAU_67740 [Dictyobacter aurantiacus]|uniref:Uncharacterized protein n=1 Tax=Dictyobacter aurantiacus TaxID=1936993 RepID=A0A401ZRF2_9CHLR|nr:hypothetical protein KDAU_67740 [Dictyobacter aurantiacus]